jgi:hypothetical protein
MEESELVPQRYQPLRTLARGWSLASLSFFFLVLADAVLLAGGLPDGEAWLGFAFFPLGVMLGLLLAWRSEPQGGLLTLLSLLAFYAWHLQVDGSFPEGPYFAILAAPGLLFLLAWLADRAGASHSSTRRTA